MQKEVVLWSNLEKSVRVINEKMWDIKLSQENGNCCVNLFRHRPPHKWELNPRTEDVKESNISWFHSKVSQRAKATLRCVGARKDPKLIIIFLKLGCPRRLVWLLNWLSFCLLLFVPLGGGPGCGFLWYFGPHISGVLNSLGSKDMVVMCWELCALSRYRYNFWVLLLDWLFLHRFVTNFSEKSRAIY